MDDAVAVYWSMVDGKIVGLKVRRALLTVAKSFLGTVNVPFKGSKQIFVRNCKDNV